MTGALSDREMPPQPDGVRSLDELAARLQELRTWSGLPYRALHREVVRGRRERRIAEPPAFDTVHWCLQPGRTRIDAGPVDIGVRRDRDGTFEPVIVPKRARRLSDLDAVVLSLSAKGLTYGEISAHFAEVYGASVSKDVVGRITDRVVAEMQAWWARPLERVYAAVFIDAIMVKVRDGQVRNKPVYAAIGVDLAGHKDILGMWAGDGNGESAKFWYAVLTDLKARGVKDVVFVVCDGLKGLPDSVGAVFPAAIEQTCVIHLIRGTFRYASRKYWDQLSKDLKPIYRAPTVEAACHGRTGPNEALA